MTVVNPDSIAGITSVTSSGTTLEFYDVNGNLLDVSANLTGQLTVGTGATINSPAANAIDFETNGEERLRIHSNGNMSLGSSSAPTKFGIRGTSASTDSTVQIVGNSVSTLLLGQDADGGVIRGQGGNNALKFKVGGGGDTAATTGGTEALRILSSGNVGIGTDIAPHKLSVKGTISKISGASGIQLVNIANDASNHGTIAIMQSGGVERIKLHSSGASYFNGGALLVGTTTPTYGSGDMQHEIKKDNSRGYTAPLMVGHSHLLLNNSDTSTSTFCGIGIRAGSGDGAIGFVYGNSANNADFVVATDGGSNGIERIRVTNSGALLVGTSVNSVFNGGRNARVQIEGTDSGTSSLAITRNSNDQNPAYLSLGKSKGTAVNSNTAVADDTVLGCIEFNGSDGSGSYNRHADIRGAVDGAPGNSDAPGRIQFRTTPDGSTTPRVAGQVLHHGGTTWGPSTAVEGNMQWTRDTNQIPHFFWGGPAGAGQPTDGCVVIGSPQTDICSQRVGTILFGSTTSGGSGNSGLKAGINCRTNASPGSDFNAGGNLIFQTKANNVSLAEKMRLDSNGRLSIGLDSGTIGDATYYDDIVINNISGGSGAAGGAGIQILSNSSSWGGLIFGDQTSNCQVGYVKYDHGNDKLVWGANSSERMALDTFTDGTHSTTSGVLGINDVTPAAEALALCVKNKAHQDSNLPVVHIERVNNHGGGSGTNEIALNVTVPRTHNNANDVYTIKSYAEHNLNSTHFAGHFEAKGSQYDAGGDGAAVYATTHKTDTNGGGYVPAFYAYGRSTYNANSNGYAVGMRIKLNAYEPNRGILIHHELTNSNWTRMISFHKGSGANGTEVGSIKSSNNATQYNTSSDYRLKENVVDLTGAITRLKQLKPKRFNFKNDTSKTVDGFIAHEVEPVVPQAVSGTKDAVKIETVADPSTGKTIMLDDGTPKTETVIDAQEVDYSKLSTLTIAALQEALAKIETLEAKVATLDTLESKVQSIETQQADDAAYEAKIDKIIDYFKL